MRHVGGAAIAVAVLGFVLAGVGPSAQAAAADLAGSWELNRDLSSPPGSGPGGPDPGARRRPGGGGGRGPGGGGGVGGGGGRGPGGGGGFGGGGGRARGGPPAGAPSREDMEARRALMQEVLTLPARVTITQDGNKVVFIEPDGVVRTYVANGASEKHQLTNGTIETKSKWNGAALRMEITIGARATLVRTFEVRDDPRRLEVATAFAGGRKDQAQLTVYDETPGR